MATMVLPLSEVPLDALGRFSARTWPERPAGAAFLTWRYRRCPGMGGYAALRDGAVVAHISAQRRRYRVHGAAVEVLETFDWFCLPELRASGLGVRVLQRVLAEGPPVLAIGGSEDTVGLLPRLGFHRGEQDARLLALPVGAQAVAGPLGARLPGPAASAAAAAFGAAMPAAWRLLRPRTPRGWDVVPTQAIPALDDLSWDGLELAPWPAPEEVAWMGAAPALGALPTLLFYEGGRLRGVGLGRVHEDRGARVGQILHLHAPASLAGHLGWMAAALVDVLLGYGPGVIRARATLPAVAEALRALRFSDRGGAPVFLRGDALPRQGALHLMSLEADAPLLPYPTPDRWGATPHPTPDGDPPDVR